MSILAEFSVPASEFVLADTLAAAPATRIEIERVAGGTEHVTPYFWATGESLDAFDRALRNDGTTREVLTLEDDAEDERFYRVTWEAGVPNLVTAVAQVGGTVLEATSDEAEASWSLRALFPDQDALSSFHDYCLDHGLAFTLERVYRPENPQEQAEYGVTSDQQEALEAAYHAGYFNVPRDQTLTGLADELGISRNALSARIRRGHRNLLSHTLIHDE